MFDTIREDFGRYYGLLPPERRGTWSRFVFFLSCQGMWALLEYWFRRWLATRSRPLRLLLRWPAFVGHVLVGTLTGISLPTGCEIGKGLYIGHFGGIFLHDEVVLGEGCSLSQGVTIGVGGKGEGLGSPRVGRGVYFGPGAKVFGRIAIGDGVRVGANAVVLSSVPEGATAVGVPARILPAAKRAP